MAELVTMLLVITWVVVVGVVAVIIPIKLAPISAFIGYHFLYNILFLSWAIYDMNFTSHYAHGPNSLFIIVPSWLFLTCYYSAKIVIGFRKNILPPSMVGVFAIAGAYVVGIVLVIGSDFY